jgi:hypothetical protein
MEKLVVVAVACVGIPPRHVKQLLLTAIALSALAVPTQAADCPAVLMHPYVQHVANNTRSSGRAAPRYAHQILDWYQSIDVLHRGPSFAEVLFAWNSFPDTGAVLAACFPRHYPAYAQAVEAEQRAEQFRLLNERVAERERKERAEQAEQDRIVAERVEAARQAALAERAEQDRITNERIAAADRKAGQEQAEADRIVNERIAEANRKAQAEQAEADRLSNERVAEATRKARQEQAERRRVEAEHFAEVAREEAAKRGEDLRKQREADAEKLKDEPLAEPQAGSALLGAAGGIGAAAKDEPKVDAASPATAMRRVAEAIKCWQLPGYISPTYGACPASQAQAARLVRAAVLEDLGESMNRTVCDWGSWQLKAIYGCRD